MGITSKSMTKLRTSKKEQKYCENPKSYPSLEKMFSSWWSKGSTGSFSCELGQEVKLNGLILGAGAFGQLHSGTQNKQNHVSIFVSSESMIGAASSAVKKLKTLRHPSVILYI